MKVLISLLLSIVCISPLAQPSDTKGMDGYVEFADLSAAYGEPKVQIDLGEKLLRFVGKMDQDKEAAEIFNKLKAVRVEVYNVNQNTGPAIAVVDKVTAELRSRSWEPVVIVTEGKERVRIFVKLNDKVIDGLVLMAVGDKDEAVFINIIGEIDPSQVAKVTKALNVDVDVKTK